MTLSPWVPLATVAFCCGLMIGGVGAVAATDSSTSKPNQQHGFVDKDTDTGNDPFHRRLETRACGEQVGKVTEAEMRALASTLLTYILEQSGASGLLANSLSYFTSSLRNDIVAYKVCGSCAEAQASLSERALLQDESALGSFSSYCAGDKYGYSAQHSALVFVPVVTTDTTTAVTERSYTDTTTIELGSLRSFIAMHRTQVSVSSAPTEAWPTNLTEALALDDSDDILEILKVFVEYLSPLVTAGSGAVAIMPDYIGYGESSVTHNRTFGYPPTYMQATMTTWVATKQAIEQDTYEWSINDGNGGCTDMDSVVSLAGVSEGGYAAIAAAPALQQAGLRVLGVNAGATFLDLGDNLDFAIESFDTGLVSLEKDNAAFYSTLPYSAFAFSSENPGLANSGTEQLALAPEWTVPNDFDSNIISWLESPGNLTGDEVALRMMAINPTEILNADYLDLVRQARAANVSFACNSEFVLENVTDKLCEAINSGSLLNVVADYDIPLRLCYSEDDTVMSPRLFMDSEINVFGNPNVKKYWGPLGVLGVSGDHSDAIYLCTVAPLEFLIDNIGYADRLNLISPLVGEQAAVCASSKTVPTPAPTGMPSSGAPMMFSRAAASSGIALAVALLSLSMF